MTKHTHAYEDEPELLTIADVANALGVSRKTVRRWEAIGKISAIRTPGGHRRFKRADVDRLISH